jgi:hypothetical protein
VNEYKSELYQTIPVNENNILIKLSSLLPDPAIKGIDYKAIFKDPSIHRCQLLAKKFPVLQISVDDFKKDYNALLFKYLESYSRTLQTTGDFPDSHIDKSKTNELIEEIRKFVESQKGHEKHEPDAFK